MPSIQTSIASGSGPRQRSRRRTARSGPSWGRRRAARPSPAASWRPRGRRSRRAPARRRGRAPGRCAWSPRRRRPSSPRATAGGRRAPRRGAARPRSRRATSTPLEPDAIRITVSFVDSWPSTLTRSKERGDARPEQQLGRLGRQPRVGLHEAEHRREAGRDHARALALGAQSHAARRQLDLEVGPLLEAVGGLDRRAGTRRRPRGAAASAPAGCPSGPRPRAGSG